MLQSHRTLILDDDVPNWRNVMIWPRVSLEMSRLRAMMALKLNFYTPMCAQDNDQRADKFIGP